MFLLTNDTYVTGMAFSLSALCLFKLEISETVLKMKIYGVKTNKMIYLASVQLLLNVQETEADETLLMT